MVFFYGRGLHWLFDEVGALRQQMIGVSQVHLLIGTNSLFLFYNGFVFQITFIFCVNQS